jgi:hypothetical protein
MPAGGLSRRPHFIGSKTIRKPAQGFLFGYACLTGLPHWAAIGQPQFFITFRLHGS